MTDTYRRTSPAATSHQSTARRNTKWLGASDDPGDTATITDAHYTTADRLNFASSASPKDFTDRTTGRLPPGDALTAGSSVLSYLQRRTSSFPPTVSSPNRQHSPGDPHHTASGRTAAVPPRHYAIRRRSARYGHGIASLKAQGRLLAFKTKAALLLRMLGSALGTVARFATLVLLIIPVSATVYRYGTNQPRIGLKYAQAAVSCAGQFVILSFCLLTLIHHSYNFAPVRTCIQQELRKPKSLMTVALIARVFSAFAACILTAVGFSVTVRDLFAPAVIGILTVLDDIANRRFYFNWMRQFPSLKTFNKTSRYGTARSPGRLAVLTGVGLLTSMAATMILWSNNLSGQRSSVIRLGTALLLSPFPLPSVVTESSESYESTFATVMKISLIGLSAFWAALWVAKVRLDFDQASTARLLDMDEDFLLSLSGRSFTGQYAVWSHLISLVEDFSDQQITSSKTMFLESELIPITDIGDQESGPLQPQYLFLPQKTLEEIRREQWTSANLGQPIRARVKRQGYGNDNSAQTLLYRVAARLFGRRRSGPISPSTITWLSVAGVCLSQKVARHWAARLLLFGLQPQIFLGIPPTAFEPPQLETLSGRIRPRFFSPFSADPHKIILSGEATRLLFSGQQIFLAILKRQIALIRALQFLLFVTETITVTPPTGSFIRSIPTDELMTTDSATQPPLLHKTTSKTTSGSSGTNARKNRRHESILRYNPGIQTAAAQGFGLLLGYDSTMISLNMSRLQHYVPFTAEDSAPSANGGANGGVVGASAVVGRSKWLKFDDGTVGLMYSDRTEFLELCREALTFNLKLSVMSLEATLGLTRVQKAFFPRDGAAEQSSSGFRRQDEQPLQRDEQPQVASRMAGLQWDVQEKLKQHFPSLNQMLTDNSNGMTPENTAALTDGITTSGSAADSIYGLRRELLGLVAHSAIAAGQFAAIPNCAPYATRHPVLSAAAEATSTYMKQWIIAIKSALNNNDDDLHLYDEVIPTNIISPAKRKRI